MEGHSGVSFSRDLDAITCFQRTEGYLFGVSGVALLEILQKRGNLSFLSSFLALSS